MTIADLISTFNKRNQKTLFTRYENKLYRLHTTDKDLLTLESSYNSDDLFLYAVAAEVSKQKEKEAALQALSGNLFGIETGKASLGYLPNKGLMVLFDRLHATITSHELEERIRLFLGALHHWKEKFGAMEDMETFNLERHLIGINAQSDLKIFFA